MKFKKSEIIKRKSLIVMFHLFLFKVHVIRNCFHSLRTAHKIVSIIVMQNWRQCLFQSFMMFLHWIHSVCVVGCIVYGVFLIYTYTSIKKCLNYAMDVILSMLLLRRFFFYDVCHVGGRIARYHVRLSLYLSSLLMLYMKIEFIHM